VNDKNTLKIKAQQAL